MNIVSNDRLIRRNTRIAQFCMLGGLVVLVGGMFVSFRYPEMVTISLGALMVGFLLSQIGIYFSNRWGRSPRPDEQLSNALKGLDHKFTLYHYSTPVSHLLVGPTGVWILLPRHQVGTISYSKGRWRQKGGNPYLKIFAQEGIGRPDLEIIAEAESLQKFLSKVVPIEKQPPIQTALVMTSPKATVNISEDDQPPSATVVLKELKDLVRKPIRGKTLSAERIKMLTTVLEGRPYQFEEEAPPKETEKS